MINDPGRTVTDVFDNGKEFVLDLKKDSQKKIKNIVKKGKKYRNEIPNMKTIENKFSKGLKAFPARINLASKQDIEKLIKSMEALNKKLDTLNSKYSA
jgi:polyhydroxyalkanoate synthesis regulator phasin